MAITRPLLVCAIICLAFALPERFNIEEEMAPKSFSIQYYRYPSLTSSTKANFHEETLDFEEITPTVVFGYGTGYQQMETMVKWNESKNSFTKKGNLNFNDLVSNFPGFKRAKKLVVIAHGWSDGKVDSCDDAWVSKMARTIRENDLNVATIALCWNSKFWTQIKPTEIFGKSSKQSGVGKLCLASFGPTSKIYFTHAATTGKVGEFLASILKSIRLNNKNIFIHGIGHSLGAHIMGNIFNFGGLKLDRISGLDPAGPCFEGKLGDIRLPERGLTKWGLNSDAAEFVDNYHTDGENYGTYISMGDMDFFIGEIDENGVSDASSQPTCSECVFSCCHRIVREYFTRSILQKDQFQTAYQSNFVAVRPNGTSWILKGKQRENSKMYAGYHAEKPSYFSKKKRMFLPMFNNKYDEDEWAAVCDLENLREKEKEYCVTQGAKIGSTRSSQAIHTTRSTSPTRFVKPFSPTPSIGSTRSSQALHTTRSTSPTRSVKPFGPTPSIGSTLSSQAIHTTRSTSPTRSVKPLGTTRFTSTPSMHSTPTTTTKLTGPFTNPNGTNPVYYREEEATSGESKVFLTCKRSGDGKEKSNCFVNTDAWGIGYTKSEYYGALAEGFAKSNCTTRAVLGPDGCFWDKKKC